MRHPHRHIHHDARAELDDSEREPLAIVLGRLRAMLYRIDGHGRFVRLRGARAFCGVDPDELLGSNRWHDELVLPEHAARRAATLRRAREGRLPFVIDYRYRHGDGGVRWAREQGSLEPATGGGERTIAGIISDITELKRLESARDAALRREHEARAAAAGAELSLAVRDEQLRKLLSLVADDASPPGPELVAAIRALAEVMVERPGVRATALQGKRLLLVDDDPDMLEVLATGLEGLGAELLLADSAAQALAMCAATPPDLVVSDIGMPGEDGLSLIARLRALPKDRGSAAPAIALTAYAGAEWRARAMRAGFDVYLCKPVDPDQLVGVLADLAMRGPG
jgi:PAS domain S-box-containing protein